MCFKRFSYPTARAGRPALPSHHPTPILVVLSAGPLFLRPILQSACPARPLLLLPLASQPSCAALLNFIQILKMKSKFSYYNDYFETTPSPIPTPMPPAACCPFLFFSFLFASLIQLLLLLQQLCFELAESFSKDKAGGPRRSF